MSNRKPFVCVFAMVSVLVLLLQGCFAQPTPVVTPSAAPQSAAAVTASDTSMPTTAPPTDTPTPTLSPTPTPAPTPVPYSTKGFTTHEYAAGDGKQIYYFSNDGVHCMNKDGSGDIWTSIVKFKHFLSFNTHGLYYIAADNDDIDDDASGYLESVMVLDAGTQAITPIKNHVWDAAHAGSKIYMIDGVNHSHIICYDMAKETMTDIKGLPSKFNDTDVENFLYVENGQVYVQCPVDDDWEIYRITGSNVTAYTEPAEDTDDTDQPQETPDPDDNGTYYKTSDGAQFRLDNQTDTLAFWTGSEYDDLDIPNIYHITVSGKKLYVLSYEEKDNWPEGPGDDYSLPSVTKGSPYTLYRVSSDGTFKKLSTGVDKAPHDSGLGDSAVCDVIGGWYFAFWETDYGDSGGITGLLLKKKVA